MTEPTSPQQPARADGAAARWLLSAGRMRAAAVALAVLLVLALQWAAPGWMRLFDARLTSSTWQMAELSDPAAQERRVVVIDIDEKSVQALGPWPWPRERVAQLLSELDRQGVAAKSVDILFDGTQPQDDTLRRALQQGAPSVIAQLFALDAQQPVRTGTLAGAWPSAESTAACAAVGLAGTERARGAAVATGYIAPATSLHGAAGVGHITPRVDADGAVRRVPAVVCHEGRAYPSLVVATLAAVTGGQPRWLREPAAWGTRQLIDVGGLRLPVAPGGDLMVSYQMPRTGFTSIPAADVLAGRVNPELLRGVIALVGSTAMGAGDAVPTPQGGAVGGIEVHAQLISAALDGRTPAVPIWAGWVPWLAAGLLVAALWGLLRRGGSPGVALPAAAVGGVVLLWGGHAVLLLQAHQMVAWGGPALLVLLAATLLLAAEMLRVRLERERLYHNLSSYLPEGAARRVALAPPSAQVQAQRQEATVMFVDLRNFSAYCEGRDPADAATVLHLFYTTVDGLVRQSGGVVEQVVGDSVMAVWNGSTPCADHAQRAVAVAEVIWRDCVAQLPRTASRSVPPLDVGIGIESGSVMVGSFGPARRRVHSVMGEAVTVASRLEGLTAELAYPVLLGPQVVVRSGNAQVKPLGDFLLAGLSQPRKVHALPIDVGPQYLRLVYDIEQDRAVGP